MTSVKQVVLNFRVALLLWVIPCADTKGALRSMSPWVKKLRKEGKREERTRKREFWTIFLHFLAKRKHIYTYLNYFSSILAKWSRKCPLLQLLLDPLLSHTWLSVVKYEQNPKEFLRFHVLEARNTKIRLVVVMVIGLIGGHRATTPEVLRVPFYF